VIRNLSGLIPLLIALALALVAPPLRAEKKPVEGAAPPTPMEVAIKVKREVRTEIPLQTYARRNELLKFLIRTPPEHGQITEPAQTGKETASVIYDPPADLSITRDKFYFAVQSSEGVSAPVEVSITIIDAPPSLVIPGPMDFPKILAGTASAKIIELSNHGGGRAAGEMIVDAPWRIAGSSVYRLGAGEVAAFKLVFEPKEGGLFEGAISFSSDREHSTLLHGEAFTPLAVSPAKVTMENRPGDPVRTGSFEISNQTDEERTLQIRGGARILAPESVGVPAHGNVTVPIQTSASDIEPIDAEIRIESEGFSLTVPVNSPAVSPIFKFSAKRVLLGRQPAAKPGTGRSVVIENTGGSPGAVTLLVAAPFVVDPSKAVINAGEKKSVQITLAPSAPGIYRTWLELRGGRQELEVDLEAELYASAAQTRVAAGIATLASAPEAETLHAEPVPPEAGGATTLTIPKEWGIASAYVPEVKLLQTTPDSATLEWPEKLSPAKRFRFELRHLGLDASRTLTVSWIEHHAVTVQNKNGHYIATLGDLRPREISAVQVFPLNDAGEPGPRLFALAFSTPAVPPSTPQISPLQWLLFALVVCLGVWVWRTVRHAPTNYL
jgi:hypothetical protein